MNRKSNQVQTPEYFVTENGIIKDPYLISNQLNNYFINVGPDISKNLRNTNKKDNAKSFLKHPNPHSLFFQPTTTYEVNKIVSNLKNKSSYGQDLVSSKILKATINTDLCTLQCKIQ